MRQKKHNGMLRRVSLFSAIAVVLVLCPILSGQGIAAEQIRESILAGQWYPSDPDRLKSQLHHFLKQVRDKPPEGKLLGLVVPHAGYIYSGQIAAHAYKLLEKHHFQTIVVIAPSHRFRFKGVSVYDRGGYRTPLGLVPLDHEFIRHIQNDNTGIRYVAAAHTKEHSLEIQLPFLQVVAPGSKLVPLVMGEQSLAACRKLAGLLVESARDKSVLLIASTDLSHYHPYDRAKALDSRIIRHAQAMDAEGLSRDLDKGACEACGGGPMMTVLIAARLFEANHSKVLKAANSGDVTGDHSRVVGYMAASFWRIADRKVPSASKNNQSAALSQKDKILLHEITRMSIEAHLSGKEFRIPGHLPPSLKEIKGAFVTLRKQGRLRGCIGHVVGRLPLAETVSHMAVAAAAQDPRFMPVRKEEFDELEFEISVMSPLEPLDDVNDLIVGTHGIYISKGVRSGLLLPQVATEYGWDRKTFLEQTCGKASLPKNAWQDPDTRIFIFSAEVF